MGWYIRDLLADIKRGGPVIWGGFLAWLASVVCIFWFLAHTYL